MKIGILSQYKERNLKGVNKVTVAQLTTFRKIFPELNFAFIGNSDWLHLDLPYVPALTACRDMNNLNWIEKVHKFNVIHSHYCAFHVAEHIKCGKILTIHDMLPIAAPQYYSESVRDWQDKQLRACAKKSDDIVAVSEFTKKQIVELYNIKPEKVHVIYNALFPLEKYMTLGTKPENFHIREGSFLFSVSAFIANKNQNGMIKAFIEYLHKNPDSKIYLVIAGEARSMEQQDIINDIDKKFLKYVIFTGYTSDEELVWLYRNCLAVIYPSFCEGFGLPVLEGMYLGKAVITSNTSSLPEVGGNAVEYCNPYDIGSIAQSIEHVVHDDSYRNKLELSAIKQAAKFSYEANVRKTIEIYRKYED